MAAPAAANLHVAAAVAAAADAAASRCCVRAAAALEGRQKIVTRDHSPTDKTLLLQ